MTSRTDRVWETFLRSPDDLARLHDGATVALVIRDLSPGRYKYRLRHVLAALTPTGTGDDDGELRVRTVVGVLLPDRWRLRIVKELPAEIPGPPYQHFFESLRRAAAELQEVG